MLGYCSSNSTIRYVVGVLLVLCSVIVVWSSALPWTGGEQLVLVIICSYLSW